MSSDRRFYFLLLGIVVLIATLVFWGLRAEQRFEQLETRQRAPTSPPLQTFSGALRQAASGQTVYVPVYSHVYATGGKERLLEVTLSVRNTDREHGIVLSSVRYYDTEGRQIAEYLDAPVVLGPLASTDFLVEHRDRSGGTGANFLIDWAAEQVVTEPVVEAVMVNHEGNRSFSFVRPGYPLSRYETEAGD